MCDICDGATYEEVHDRQSAEIAKRGWTVQYVEAADLRDSWGYTVGLVVNFGHPELALVGGEPEATHVVLDQFAEWVADGDRFDPGPIHEIDGLEFEFHRVHPAQLRHGTFASWVDQYAWLPEPPAFEAVEMILPATAYCSVHGKPEPRLASDVRLDARFRNRAARRRAARGRRRQ